MKREGKEFYIGYQEKIPPGIARFLRGHVVLMILVGVLIAVLFAMNQKPVEPGTFEFGSQRQFEGWIVEDPFPMLRLERPGHGFQSPTHSLYPLVVFGKFGGHDAVAGMAGKKVRLQGTMIYRDDQVMLEISRENIEILEEQSIPKDDMFGQELGMVTMLGEIVDSKCFLGVMKPGNLKTHKACAVRCISGGIPPVLVVRDAAGNARYFILVGEDGKAINKGVLPFVAEPVRVTGKAVAYDNLTMLYTRLQDIVITR